MTNVNVTTKCAECSAPTHEGFHFGPGIHDISPKHEDVVFTKVTGKPPKPTNSEAKK